MTAPRPVPAIPPSLRPELDALCDAMARLAKAGWLERIRKEAKS